MFRKTKEHSNEHAGAFDWPQARADLDEVDDEAFARAIERGREREAA